MVPDPGTPVAVDARTGRAITFADARAIEAASGWAYAILVTLADGTDTAVFLDEFDPTIMTPSDSRLDAAHRRAQRAAG